MLKAVLCEGRLVGTHAHELMMVTAQLLAGYDDAAGGAEGPVAASALLSHLLFLRANGGLASATALPDTFGTVAFVEVRPVFRVNQGFGGPSPHRRCSRTCCSRARTAAWPPRPRCRTPSAPSPSWRCTVFLRAFLRQYR